MGIVFRTGAFQHLFPDVLLFLFYFREYIRTGSGEAAGVVVHADPVPVRQGGDDHLKRFRCDEPRYLRIVVFRIYFSVIRNVSQQLPVKAGKAKALKSIVEGGGDQAVCFFQIPADGFEGGHVLFFARGGDFD